jgi:hypothetical protein
LSASGRAGHCLSSCCVAPRPTAAGRSPDQHGHADPVACLDLDQDGVVVAGTTSSRC